MKVIDLFNKIANGEEVPFEIKLFGVTFCFNNEKQWYFSKYDDGDDECNILDMHSHLLRNKNKSLLNEEVEIIEEPRNIEVCGSLFTKSEYDELTKSNEDKKIEKLGAFNIKKFYDDYPETANFILEIFKKQEEIIERVNGE